MQELIMCLTLLSIISVIYMSRSHQATIRELAKDYYKSKKAEKCKKGKSKEKEKEKKSKDKKKKHKKKGKDTPSEEPIEQSVFKFQDIEETESIELGEKRPRESDKPPAKQTQHPLLTSLHYRSNFFDRQKKFYESIVSEIPEIHESQTSSLKNSFEEHTKPKQLPTNTTKHPSDAFKTNGFQGFPRNGTDLKDNTFNTPLFSTTKDRNAPETNSKNGELFKKSNMNDSETHTPQGQGLFGGKSTSLATSSSKQPNSLFTDGLFGKKEGETPGLFQTHFVSQTEEKPKSFLDLKPTDKGNFNPGFFNLPQTVKKQSTEETAKGLFDREDEYPNKRAKKFDAEDPTKHSNLKTNTSLFNQTQPSKTTALVEESSNSKLLDSSEPQTRKKTSLFPWAENRVQGNNPFEDAFKNNTSSDAGASNFTSAKANNSSKLDGLFTNPSSNASLFSAPSPQTVTPNSLFQKDK